MSQFEVDGVPVAMPPPEGYVVDFENPQRAMVAPIYIVYAAGNFFCLFFMLQRVYVRAFVQRCFKPEDACLFVAYAFSITIQSLHVRDYAEGILGIHGWEMPLSKYMLFVRAMFLNPILYNPVQFGCKMALLLVYRRLAPQLWFQIMVYMTMATVTGTFISMSAATIFPCQPVQAAWDITITDAKCINRNAVYKATAALGAGTDILVLAIPIPVVIPLQIPRRQKFGLIAFFSIGGLTVFTSIMRLVALIDSMGLTDQSWGCGPVVAWIFAEANLSCISASLTTIKPFIKHISPRILGSSNTGSKTGLSLGKNSAPPTVGGTGALSKNRYDKYQRFDDGPLYPMQTLTAVEAAGEQREGHWRGERQESIDAQGDSSSEKAIMQTRTTTVTYGA